MKARTQTYVYCFTTQFSKETTMKRITLLFAALIGVAAIMGVTPAAHAQTACLGSVNSPSCFVHFVGAGSSAQFNPAAIGADALALTKYNSSTQCVYHWSAKNGANLVDKRGTVAIPLEPGNSWIVWIANLDSGATCPNNAGTGTSTGNNGITDIWMDVSVDSTVGNRAFLAQNTTAFGGSGVAVETIALSAGNLLGTGSHNTWPDNASDVSILSGGATNIPVAVGTSQSGVGDVHINAGLTDIRPEDALFATTRSIGALTSTRSGLGYNSTANVGASILSSEPTGTNATPVKFGIVPGAADPINNQKTGGVPVNPVRSYVTVPIGAAPIVFVYNNNNDSSSELGDLETGVLGTGVANGTGWPTTDSTTGKYLAANLFDGSSSCDTHNKAFGGAGDGLGTPLHLFLREPLSGTMNTTEYNVFRTTGNVSDSQEQNVSVTAGSGDNPLSAKACGCGVNGTCSGAGDRSRGIGTGEIVGTSSTGVIGTAYGLGYIFYGFSNAAKFGCTTFPCKYNYLTLDGVDPLGFTNGMTIGELPDCGGPCAATTYWPASGTAPAGYSYPNLRNGTYKAWSLYRWLVPSPDSDPYGPTELARYTENNVDGTSFIADFVPFQACPSNDPTCSSSTPTDGLDVYRSHFTQSAITCTYTGTLAAQTCDGPATAQNALDNGDALGGTNGTITEAGGDVGGLIVGWDHSTVTTAAVTTGACKGKATKVTHTAGRNFGISASYAAKTAGNPLALEGNSNVFINGSPVTVNTCIAPSATVLYVTQTIASGTGNSFAAYILPTSSGVAAGDNGVLAKKN
jgi:hypothetical protein